MMKLLPLLFVLLIFSWDATAASRVALVIGNNDYPDEYRLENAINDANAIATVLEQLDFDVIKKSDLDDEGMERALNQFTEKLKAGTPALFYYAGHAVQVNGLNYLIPAGPFPKDGIAVKHESLSLSLVLDRMEDAGSFPNIILLDACRDNPFTSSRKTRSIKQGLAAVGGRKGTAIIFATSPGELTFDGGSLGSGDNSPFAAALKTALRKPGQTIPGLFEDVSADVEEKTNNRQSPHMNVIRMGNFVFSPVQKTISAPIKSQPATVPSARQLEVLFWKTVRNSHDLRDFQSYLNEYPNGIYAGLAKVKTRQLSTTAKATALSVQISNKKNTKNRNFTDPTTGMEFVFVKGGCFMMGSHKASAKETPVHEVCIGNFFIGKYEVTQKQWRQVVGNNPSRFKGNALPVESVRWEDVQDFIRILNSRSSNHYRLPTESEWEYAARSGGKNEVYSGGNNVERVAWYWDNCAAKTHPVGRKSPNGLGLYDMSGNVSEWVQDRWHDNYTGAPADGSAWEGTSVSDHVFRGGGWFISLPTDVRTSGRAGARTAYRYNDLGFRLVLSSE